MQARKIGQNRQRFWICDLRFAIKKRGFGVRCSGKPICDCLKFNRPRPASSLPAKPTSPENESETPDYVPIMTLPRAAPICDCRKLKPRTQLNNPRPPNSFLCLLCLLWPQKVSHHKTPPFPTNLHFLGYLLLKNNSTHDSDHPHSYSVFSASSAVKKVSPKKPRPSPHPLNLRSPSFPPCSKTNPSHRSPRLRIPRNIDLPPEPMP